MSSSRALHARLGGFTLLEVLAGVLVLGMLYTVLAGAAMRGLRSEGTDRRRAEAALIADRELANVETLLNAGEQVGDGMVEREEPPYLVRIDVQPEDLLAMLPADVREEVKRANDPHKPSALHDERGESRVRRVSVQVQWDEAGEPDYVQRTTYAYDVAALEALFPSKEEGAPPEEGEEAGEPEIGSLERLMKDAPPEMRKAIQQEQGQGR